MTNITSHQNINLQSQYAQTTIVSNQQTNLTSQNGNTQLVSHQNTNIQSQNGQVVVENVTFNSNTISTTAGDLNINSQGGNIYTQDTNLDLGAGVLTVDTVVRAHVPRGAIMIWYGSVLFLKDGGFVMELMEHLIYLVDLLFVLETILKQITLWTMLEQIITH